MRGDKNSTVTVTGLTEAGKKLKTLYIPERSSKKKVTKIYFRAFDNGAAMERIYISDTVKYLDYWEDYEGTNLRNDNCFHKGCDKLREIHLGKSVEAFGASNNLPKLEKITVSQKNKTYRIQDGILFSGENTLICYPAGKKDTSYTIPQEITKIGAYAFAWSRNLEKVNFPAGITSLYGTFQHSGLKEIVIPEGIQDFPSAFENCDRLEKAAIPSLPDNSYIANAFKNCRSLKTVTMKNLPKYFGGDNFAGCSSLEEIQLPPEAKGVVQKDGVLFDSTMENLLIYPSGKKEKSYTLPAGVKRIGPSAFAGAQYLSEVIADKELEIIDDSAFEGAKIEKVQLNEGLQKMEYGVFAHSDIIEVNLPDSLKNVGYSTFEYCGKLRSVKLPANLEEFNRIFYHCPSLQTLHIPKNVKTLWKNIYGLSGCTSLTSITVDPENQYFTAEKGVLYSKSKKKLIAYPAAKKGTKFSVPKSVTKIAIGAFSDSRYLQEISMKDKVTACENNVFSNGAALKKVRLPKNLKQLGDKAFSGCRKLQKITIPDNLKTVKKETFDGCTGLKSIILGKKMKKISENAFRDCKSMRKITFRKKTWERNLTPEKCFVRTGSKNYRKLILQMPKKWRVDKKLMTNELHSAGLSKKAKIKYHG